MSWVPAAPTSEKEDLNMKLVVVVLASLTLFAAGQSVNLSDASHVGGHSQTIIDPRLESARLKGNKIIVTGRDFSDAATIFINNEPVATRSDSESPATRLFAKWWQENTIQEHSANLCREP
jgi:hypothetical protein